MNVLGTLITDFAAHVMVLDGGKYHLRTYPRESLMDRDMSKPDAMEWLDSARDAGGYVRSQGSGGLLRRVRRML